MCCACKPDDAIGADKRPRNYAHPCCSVTAALCDDVDAERLRLNMTGPARDMKTLAKSKTQKALWQINDPDAPLHLPLRAPHHKNTFVAAAEAMGNASCLADAGELEQGRSLLERCLRAIEASPSNTTTLSSGLKMQIAELTSQFETHAVVDFVVLQRDVVFENRVPLLNADLLRARARLRREQLLQVADGVILVAFDADFFPEPVIADDLDHRPSRTGPADTRGRKSGR